MPLKPEATCQGITRNAFDKGSRRYVARPCGMIARHVVGDQLLCSRHANAAVSQKAKQELIIKLIKAHGLPAPGGLVADLAKISVGIGGWAPEVLAKCAF